MKNTRNTTSENKYGKLFLRGDIYVYCSLFFCLLLLFVFLVIPKSKANSNGFAVLHDNDTVLTFTFDSQTPLKIENGYEDFTQVIADQNGYTITVYLNQEHTAYNKIYIDTKNLTAKVIESNCSERKDCFHAPAIKTNGTIYCSPHDLLIKPLSLKNDGPIAG